MPGFGPPSAYYCRDSHSLTVFSASGVPICINASASLIRTPAFLYPNFLIRFSTFCSWLSHPPIYIPTNPTKTYITIVGLKTSFLSFIINSPNRQFHIRQGLFAPVRIASYPQLHSLGSQKGVHNRRGQSSLSPTSYSPQMARTRQCHVM